MIADRFENGDLTHLMRSKNILFLIIFLVLSSPVFAQSAKDIEAVRALEDKRIEAMLKRDVKTLGELFAADATYGHSIGTMDTGKYFLERLSPGGDLTYTSLDRKEVQVRVYKNSAVITGIVALKVKAGGQDRDLGQARFLSVWIRDKGKWKFTAWQSAKIA